MSARVRVTDSNSRSALAVTRSLGRSGDFVVPCGDVPPALVGASRYSRAHALHPDPARDPMGFAAWLREPIARHRIDVLLPMTEISMRTLANDPALRTTGVRWPFGDAVPIAKERIEAPGVGVFMCFQHGRRGVAMVEFFRSLDSRTRNDTLDRDDWRPFVVESTAWLTRELVGRRKNRDRIHGQIR